MLSYSVKVVEVRERYDNEGKCETIGTCIIELDIDDEMEKPVYLYYELTNYYQNHRIYLNSRNQDQLTGEDLSKADLESCEPIVSNDDLDLSKIELKLKGLDGDDAAYPCGLVANSFFNDRFTLYEDNETIDIEEDDIAWLQDGENRFKNLDDEEKQWMDIEDGKL